MPQDNDDSLFGLSAEEQDLLHDDLLNFQYENSNKGIEEQRRRATIDARFGSFAELPSLKQLKVQRVIAEKMGILDPFFACHESAAKNTTRIKGRELLNFSTYDYLALNGHPEINSAAKEAMEIYGTSAGASRLVAGERPPHADLERAITSLYGTDDSVIFVSGHATNVSTLSTILGPRDAVYHDALAHNSLILGSVLSGAARYSFPHNDCGALERLLQQTRAKHERVIIVTEGIFSMDGSIAKLPKLIELKKEFVCFLMVDEAHSLGVLGETGRGISEHFGINPLDVDIWMGTLSKTLCGCGGYITGCSELIDLLKFCAPGFVYSVGMPPPTAAASTKAIEILLREPNRVARLQSLSSFFLKEANARGLNTGHAEGYAVVPIIVGNSLVAGQLSALCFENGYNVLPIMYPVVEEGMARLRFFLSSWHQEDELIDVLDFIAKELPDIQKKFT